MSVLRVCLAALAIVQGTKLEGPSQDAVSELRAKMEKIGSRVQGLYAAGGPLAKTKIVDRLQAWHEQFEKKVQSLDGSLVMQFQRLSEAETSVQDLSKEIDQEKTRLSAETTEQQESLLLGVLMTRQKEPFVEQLKVLVSKDFSALPQKELLNHIQANGDFKTPLVQQVAEYLDAHRQQLEAPAPTPKQVAPVPQKAEHKAVAVAEHKAVAIAEHKAVAAAEHKAVAVAEHKAVAAAEHKAVAVAEHKAVAVAATKQNSVAERKAVASNLRKLLQQQHEAGEQRRADDEEHIKVMFNAARNHKQDNPSLAKKFHFLGRTEQKKMKRKVAMEHKQEVALAKAADAVEAGDAAAAHKAQQELQDLLDEQMGKKKKFLVLLDLVGSSSSKDCPYCVGQCMEKCHNGGNTYVTCLTTCANAKA
eukprot:TRINITY_DN3770_c0_g1_i1.p1 TRINITY_DN3770_c0_g1~~TRINITY_DN3770_c0_g1_i1.p1  ORF type:complete len:439 (+),score=129.72 TRINITY_DN3770_c0_g1_i1:62-1318(+)